MVEGVHEMDACACDDGDEGDEGEEDAGMIGEYSLQPAPQTLSRLGLLRRALCTCALLNLRTLNAT